MRFHLACTFIFHFSFFIFHRSFAQAPDFRKWQNDSACKKWVDSVYNSLNVDERIGQFFMLPAYTEGKNYNMDTVATLLKQGKAGGVIFFKGLPEAQAAWTNRIQDSVKVQSFIAIDGEWGLAMRLDSTIAFPHQIALGAIADNSMIFEMGKEIGKQCRRMGIHINFAPDVDVNNNPDNPVINDRSFGENKYNVALKGIEFALGMQNEGVLACAKHFPGHGDVNTDSHFDLPIITKPVAAFDSLEFFPFRELFKNGVGSAMVAHLNVPALDSDSGSVASLSKKIATGWLRDSLGFTGLVFSDALNMKGVSKYYKPGTVDSLAFVAGCDILVFSEDAAKGIAKIRMAVDSGKISIAELETRVKKVLAYKYNLGLNKKQVVKIESLRDDLNNTGAKLLRQKLFEQAITIAANRDNLLPLKDWTYKKVASLSMGTNSLSQFQNYISNFAEIDLFDKSPETNGKTFITGLDTLSKYDLVIVDMHGMVRSAAKSYNITPETIRFLDSLSRKTKVVLVVFGNPYALKSFEFISSVMVAYEDNDATQLAAANALFGAEKISGKLPVTASSVFAEGRGFISDSIYRLKISMPEEAGIKHADLKRVDDIIKKGIEAKAFPGCQLLVTKDNKVIWNKTYGTKIYESSQKVSPVDLYDLASITKVVATTLAVMKLYEEEKLDLDNYVSEYLDLPHDATIKQLKLRNLLTHQAGLKPFFVFYKNTLGADFEKYYRKNPDTVFTVCVADSLFIRKDYPDTMWNIIFESDLEHRPKYIYSDNDFYILQKIAEQVSGKKLDDYVRENFYEPMGLTRIGYMPLTKFARERILPTELDTVFRKQLVRGYVHDPGAAMYGGVAGHAGVFSNAFDLAAVFQMLLNGGTYNGKRFLEESTIHLFTSRQSKISRRGFGFDKPEPDVTKPSPCYDAVPLSAFGHTGFTGTCVWSDPENNLTYIFLSNRVYPSADNTLLIKMNIRTELQEVIYKAMGK